MENRKKSGITLIAVTIVIVVMGILIGLTVVSTKGIVKESNARNFASELKQLEYLEKQNKILNNILLFNGYRIIGSRYYFIYVHKLEKYIHL